MRYGGERTRQRRGIRNLFAPCSGYSGVTNRGAGGYGGLSGWGTVLLVENEPVVLGLARDLLAGNGYRVLVVSSGLLLAWGEPVKLSRSPSFWAKMGLMVLVGAHALVFRHGVYGNAKTLDAGLTRQARLAAALSLILWSGLIVSGRLIAFDA